MVIQSAVSQFSWEHTLKYHFLINSADIDIHSLPPICLRDDSTLFLKVHLFFPFCSRLSPFYPAAVYTRQALALVTARQCHFPLTSRRRLECFASLPSCHFDISQPTNFPKRERLAAGVHLVGVCFLPAKTIYRRGVPLPGRRLLIGDL